MILELARVHKEYAATTGTVAALRGVDLAVFEGEYVLLTGPSGAGKTTLLHLAGLLDAPTRGEVRFEGRDVGPLSARDLAALRLARIGFVFQHHYLVPDLTVVENVVLPALARGRGASRAHELLARVGLAHAADRLPRELSGGEQQRAGIARALVNGPSLVLCDEPTGNLDPASADAVAKLLSEAHEEGATVLVVTHDPGRFPQAERRLAIADGRLGPAEDAPAAVPDGNAKGTKER